MSRDVKRASMVMPFPRRITDTYVYAIYSFLAVHLTGQKFFGYTPKLKFVSICTINMHYKYLHEILHVCLSTQTQFGIKNVTATFNICVVGTHQLRNGIDNRQSQVDADWNCRYLALTKTPCMPLIVLQHESDKKNLISSAIERIEIRTKVS